MNFHINVGWHFVVPLFHIVFCVILLKLIHEGYFYSYSIPNHIPYYSSSTMGVSAPLGLVAIGLITWYVVSCIATWYRLRHIPGPWLASFSYLWVASKIIRGRGMEYENLRKYGPLVRIGPNYILTDHPEAVKQMNGARSTANRNEWYTATKMDPDHDNLLCSIKIGPHDTRKAKTAHGYGGRDGMVFEPAVDRMIQHLVEILRTRHLSSADQLKPLDFAHFVRYFTLDIITEIAYGKAFGFMAAKEDLYGYANGVERLLGFISTTGDIPLLRRILIKPPFNRFFAPRTTDERGIGKLMGWVHVSHHEVDH